ncbi:hypothetical protein MPTK1_3g24000 [Marchantia polymorpha subsp. ruderalis]|uniref:TOG domain-containing protein n=2 Tax=Marchantia polymorpha TaxID=3197 RepID=A0AAF6B465_MARPO|nr:hypothetical protein MARPO_0121s0024 [Marchantia polymorpha]BBN06799.1 hypothetical protein Mp_3g24000 [Marchantia polymorpha subsp. ruderalis]|eukprot:PTQ30676.1 hypothetical protein MARPO_0121s0024 [Marchantia polymorpha]
MMGRSRGTAKTSGPPTQLLLIELKHRILGALHKLADRDTQQIAVDDLERIVLSLSPEGISLCLNCLYDTDAQQKSVVRRECVRLFGTLATVHGDLLMPHLTKIVTTIVRRLKDPDTNVRDACVETMGCLSAQVPGAGGEGGPMPVFVKPLFDAMGEQNRSLQIGAALCVARVFECLKTQQPAMLQKLCPRICKFFNAPSFQAKAALLSAIGSLFQAAGTGAAQYLTSLVPLAQEALENTDWATRKAAADTLARLASTVGPALVAFKPACTQALENSRFDKVKPVRDSVGEALQLWKNLPAEPENTSPGGTVANRDGAAKYFDRRQSLSNTSPTNGSGNSTGDSNSATKPGGAKKGSGKTGPESRSGSNTKRRPPPLSDMKLNPDFFKKIEGKTDDDWEIEVALPEPREAPEDPAEEDNLQAQDVKVEHIKTQDYAGNGLPNADEQAAAARRAAVEQQYQESLVWRRGEFTGTNERGSTKPGIGSYDGKTLNNNLSVITNPIPVLVESPWIEKDRDVDRDVDSWETSGPATSPSSSATYEDDGPAVSSMDEWTSVQKQLQRLEFQQRNHLKMFQEFMADVHQSMLEMDLRVRGLERVINSARDVPMSVSRIMNGSSSGYEAPPARSLNKFLASSQSLSDKLRKAANSSRAAFADRGPGGDQMASSGMRSGRSSPWKANDSDADGWDDYSPSNRVGPSIMSHAAPPMVSQRIIQNSPNSRTKRGGRGAHDSDPAPRHAWERSGGSGAYGENHVVRSVWQASKDEATLEAIRGAGEDPRGPGSELEKPLGASARMNNSDVGGAKGKETFWMLWSRAMDYIRVGDMDAAYVDVMSSGDELLLIRLMSHTGPVLNKLASGTALEMLQMSIQLLQQQSFLDSVLPWVHQVADLNSTKGPEFLGLTMDGKKELITSLQESAAMEFPEGWMASSVADVAAQLCSAWSIDL